MYDKSIQLQLEAQLGSRLVFLNLSFLLGLSLEAGLPRN
jgi:hypothetical protein